MGGLQREPAESGGRDQQIIAASFGGLNSVSSPLTMPYSDSPGLTNIDINVAGTLYKRKGTYYVGKVDTTNKKATFFPVTTGLGLSFVAVKDGTDIKLYEVEDDAINLIMTKADVFSDAAASVKASIVSTGEDEQRLIIATGTNTIVQLRFVEQSTQVSAGSPVAATLSDTLGRFANASATNTLCYDGTTRFSSTGISYATSTLTLPSHTYTNTTASAVFVCWQWWAEADLKFGSRYYDHVARNHADAGDIHVAIPTTLIDDLEYDTSVATSYRLYAGSDARGQAGWDTMAARPTTSSEYCLTNGQGWDTSDTNDRPIPAPYFISYGAIEGTGSDDPTTVHMVVARRLGFNGGAGITGANLLVRYGDYITRTSMTQNTGGAAAHDYEYTLHNEGSWDDTGGTVIPVPIASTASAATHIMFRGGTYKGVPPTAVVELINVSTPYIGSNATGTVSKYLDGGVEPIYGLWRYADFNRGFFPSFVLLYRSRLVFGGMVGNSLRVVFSAISDEEMPGSRYTGFTVDAFTANTTPAAFDYILDGPASDYCVGGGEYAGSLFIMTREACWRLVARETLSANSLVVERVGSVGAVNKAAIGRPVDRFMFLSNDGVYEIVPSEGLDDRYHLNEVSQKIRRDFERITPMDMEDSGVVEYDPLRQKFYVVVPHVYARSEFKTRVYVFFSYINSWTQYQYHADDGVVSMLAYKDTSNADHFAVIQKHNGALRFLRTEYSQHLDYCNKQQATGLANLYAPLIETTEFTAVSTGHKYEHRLFETVGLEDVQDMRVYVDGTEIEFGTDWFKQGPRHIYLVRSYESGETITVEHLNPSNNNEDPYSVKMFENNVFVRAGADGDLEQVVSWASGTDGAEPTFHNDYDTNLDATDTIEVGTCYLALYKTPWMNWGALNKYKRGIYWQALFDNTQSEDTYGLDDIALNQAAQEILGRQKVSLSTSVSFIYNFQQSGETTVDLYNARDLSWDWGTYDTFGSPLGDDDYVLLKEYLQGIGYDLQVWVWNFDNDSFGIAGYQVEGKLKGNRYAHR